VFMGRHQRNKRHGWMVAERRASSTAPAGEVNGVSGELAEVLVRVRALRDELVEVERELRAQVAEARRLRASWREVGEALDISAQGAHKRFGVR
jgi:hypothetical protein